jgi:hypothetical protein
MTYMSRLVGPTIAAAYDFGALGSLMDVGGGNSIFLLSHILRAHLTLRGVLADWDSAGIPRRTADRRVARR